MSLIAWQDRFWTKVEQTDDCWLWTGSTNGDGYGRFWCEGRKEQAHRVAYLLCVGAIPSGLCVLHRCGNPPCVNPAHLFTGTPADNARDRDAKGRNVAHSGADHYRAKLTWEDVAAIRRDVATTPQVLLARRYGVTKTNISQIVRGDTWRRPVIDSGTGACH